MDLNAHSLSDRDSVFKALSICVDNIEVGIYVSDYYTGEVLFANQKITPFAGVSDAKSMLGKPCWETLNVKGTGRCSYCPYERILDENGEPTEPYIWEVYSHLTQEIKSSADK